MVYRFILLSDEVDNFRREITVDSEATFFDLHQAILDSVGYAKDQMTSFFICDDDWSKKTEVTLVEMDSSSEEDNYVMEETRLSDLLEDEKQKLLYVFEYLTDRCFFMELRTIIPGKNQKKAEIIRSEGKAPEQVSLIEDFDTAFPVTPSATDDDDFFHEGITDDYDEEDFSELSDDIQW
jgi:hypothetical protein